MKAIDYENTLAAAGFSHYLVSEKYRYIRLVIKDAASILLEKKENYSFAELVKYLSELEQAIKDRLVEIEVEKFKQTPIYSAIVKEIETRLERNDWL